MLIVSIALLMISCNDNKQEAAYNASVMEDVTVSSRKTFSSAKRMKGQSATVVDNVKIERKLIKTGNVTFETKDLDATKKTILEVVTLNNGYIASDNQYKSDDRISSTISVRVPVKSFDSVLSEITKGVEKFDNKNVRISDVTEQFLDVEARLKTKKALEVKYLEILKKARTVREILDVERELAKVRGDIEAKEGRLKYLQNQVSFSTLNITYYKVITIDEGAFGGKIGKAFKQGFENVKAFLVSMITIWPFIIILLLLIFFVRRRVKS